MGKPTAVITGGSSGIGAATCRRLRYEGWHVVGLARRPSPDATVSLCLDITSFTDVQRAFTDLEETQLIVHAAAVVGPVTPLWVSDPDSWRQNIDVNLLGTYNILRAALSGPLAPDRGVVIHLTSGAASVAKPHWSAYNTSKAGAEHLIRSAASELGGTQRAVCALDPGLTETPMQEEIRALDFPDRDRFVRAFEEHSGRDPVEVADAIWELAHRQPCDLNGRTFRVGWLDARA